MSSQFAAFHTTSFLLKPTTNTHVALYSCGETSFYCSGSRASHNQPTHQHRYWKLLWGRWLITLLRKKVFGELVNLFDMIYKSIQTNWTQAAGNKAHATHTPRMLSFVCHHLPARQPPLLPVVGLTDPARCHGAGIQGGISDRWQHAHHNDNVMASAGIERAKARGGRSWLQPVNFKRLNKHFVNLARYPPQQKPQRNIQPTSIS